MPKESLRILLPLDGSSSAEGILAAVLPLAERRPLRLTLLGAVGRETPRPEMEAYLARVMKALQQPQVRVQAELCLGDAASAIVSHSISDRSDFIAMATHGRTGMKRLLMGSVTEKVLRRATVPLLACRPGSRMEGWAHVVALDGSPRAESILDDIVPLTRLVGATIHLLHVQSGAQKRELRGYLNQTAIRLSALGVNVTTAVREGLPARSIVDYASEAKAGVVALATHGRTGVERMLMGSVAEEVLRKVSCPVLLRRELRKTALLTPGIVIA